MAAKPEPEKPLASALVAEAKSHVKILAGFIGLLWVIQILNALSGGALTQFGIHPRSWAGLWGILFAPFLHASFAHLIANTVPLAVLGWFVMLRQKRDLLTVSLVSGLVGGLGTWLIAPAASVHIGASILIFGYLGYLLARGIFERHFWPIVGSIVTFVVYGGALFGVLPGQAGISWQGHLFGLIGGILAARLLKQPRPSAEKSAPKRIAELGSTETRLPTATATAKPEPAEEDDDIEAELARLRRMR